MSELNPSMTQRNRSGNDATSKKNSDRAEQQRERILAAAEHCFIEQGFHLASMATICETAGMSAGLVYRYFDSKNAIILAIIERQLLRMRSDLTVAQGRQGVIALLRGILHHWQGQGGSNLSPVLFLEMVACVPRDEQIKQALDKSNRAFGAFLRQWLARNSEEIGLELTEQQIQHYVFSLKCFIEGLAVRVIREPELNLSSVLASAELLFAQLLVPNPASPD